MKQNKKAKMMKMMRKITNLLIKTTYCKGTEQKSKFDRFRVNNFFFIINRSNLT